MQIPAQTVAHGSNFNLASNADNVPTHLTALTECGQATN